MDFEERLETAERSESPSLVGSSIRSADDSTHNNYIHPEKYKGKKKYNKTNLSSAINASLDDLINEGALMNSEEDFEKYLDNDGSVKTDIKAPPKEQMKKEKQEQKQKDIEIDQLRQELKKDQKKEIKENIKDSTPLKESISNINKSTKGFYKQEDYSTPNLSEYQLDHDIKDHDNLIEHVQSHDYHKLPNSNTHFKSEKPIVSTSAAQQQREHNGGNLHSSYLHTERARSRSRSANPTNRRNDDRSSSRSSINSSNPHLARGDSYKNVHGEEPAKYELPADLEVAQETNETENDDRRSRQSKPTMGDAIAKAEAAKIENEKNDFHYAPLTRDPSLVTTGDYTNFEADSPRTELKPSNNLYSTRSESSTNYLRSISRSRSRARNYGEKEVNSGTTQDEKNDANTDALIEEGALISDDPFVSIDKLDTMVEEVLHVNDNTEKKPIDKENLKKELNETGQPEAKTEKMKNDLKKESEAKVEDTKVNEETVESDVNKKRDEKDEVESNIHSESDHESKSHTLDSEVKKVDDEEKEGDKSIDSTSAPLEDEDSSDTNERLNENKLDKENGLKQPEEKSKKDVLLKSTEENSTAEESSKIKQKVTAKSDAVASKIEDKSSESTSAPVKGKDDTATHEDLVEKDVIKEEHNAKDDANPSDLISEGALVNEDALSQVDQENLKDEGITPDTKESTSEPTHDDVQEVTEKNEKVKTLLTGQAQAEDDPEEYKEIKKVDAPVDTDMKTKAAQEERKDEQVPLAPVEDAEGPSVKDPKEDAINDDLSDIDVSPEELRKHLESQPIYLFTSLAGGMQIMPRTNRLATILQANGIKFEYRDLGTDEEAKKIWKRQSNGKSLPGVIRGDDFIGNWQEIDEANEEYRLTELLYETL